MKLFYLILILSIFLQTSFIPFNLCLIILLCRSYVVEERLNLYGAFISGLFLSLLSGQNLGFWALIFLVVVKLASLIRKLPVSTNILTILPLSLILITFVSFLEKIFLNKTIDWRLVTVEVALSLPIFFLVRFWEDRFVVHSETRLKLKR